MAQQIKGCGCVTFVSSIRDIMFNSIWEMIGLALTQGNRGFTSL